MGRRRPLFDVAAARCFATSPDPREVYNALRWIVRAGAPGRMLPTNFSPLEAVYQQAQRWIAVGVFEEMGYDLRDLLRRLQGRATLPSHDRTRHAA